MNLNTESVRRGYEVTDARARPILIAGLLVALGTLLAMGVVAWMCAGYYGGRPRIGGMGAATSFQHGPDYRTSIQQAWAELEPSVRANLTEYRWIDRERGIAQIPIERAMERLAEGGER